MADGSIHPHLASLANPHLSRRAFAATTLGVGFALAVQPIQAQTVITTSAEGLTAGTVQIPVAGGALPAYRAKPATGSNFPTVMVCPEIFGVHEHIADVCRRLARLGYQAIAPEIFFRAGDVRAMADVQTIMRTAVLATPDAQLMSDFDAVAAWAPSDGGDANRLAMTGFCWGGRVVWLHAAHSTRLKAGVAWYGPLANANPGPNQPRWPLQLAGEMRAPVLGLYGGADPGIPNEQQDQMRAALRAANKTFEIVTYPDVPHGFNADYRPSYRAEPAQDGWRRMQAWFRQHGAAPNA